MDTSQIQPAFLYFLYYYLTKPKKFLIIYIIKAIMVLTLHSLENSTTWQAFKLETVNRS